MQQSPGTMNGAELTIRLLERQGIGIIPGIPGGANLPLYDALSQSTVIRHVLARHEQGAGFMAQGMARTSGKPAVFFATSGPGATNTLTAIADAKLDSVPIICITGQVPSSMIGTDAFQEVDIYGMSIPVTKHNFLVRSVEELARNLHLPEDVVLDTLSTLAEAGMTVPLGEEDARGYGLAVAAENIRLASVAEVIATCGDGGTCGTVFETGADPLFEAFAEAVRQSPANTTLAEYARAEAESLRTAAALEREREMIRARAARQG